MTPLDIKAQLVAQRIVPVVRLADAEVTGFAFDCLVRAGFSAVEISMAVPGAIGLVDRLAQEAEPGILIGAGTVLDLDTARRCIDAGARFLASPCVVPGINRMAHVAGCVVLQGGFTPGEVLAAHREGADLVKVFPASTGGPEHLRALHAMLPDVLLCPTGGVSLQNIEAYFAAGATLVGVGNSLVDQRALALRDAAGAIAHARRFLTIPALPPAPGHASGRSPHVLPAGGR